MQIVRGAHVLIVEAILVQHGTWGQGVRVVTTGRAQPASRRATSLGQEGQVRASSGRGAPTSPEVGFWGQVLEASLGSRGEPSLGAVSGLSMVGSGIGSAPPLPQVPSAPKPYPQLTNCPWLLLPGPQAARVLEACKQGVLLLQLVVCAGREGGNAVGVRVSALCWRAICLWSWFRCH